MAQGDRRPAEEERTTVPLIAESGENTVPQLVVLLDETIKAHRLPMSGSASIGRSPTNDVCINHTSVSRRHAILHIGPKMTLEDLGGANGTVVLRHRKAEEDDGGPEIKLSGQSTEVDVGDNITIGSATLVIHRISASLARRPVASDPPPPSLDQKGTILRDPAMIALYEQAALAAAGPISVLLLGETGVGKEVLARSIHRKSPRASRPFLGLNCAALSESLLESELFGHEKGAFTGALTARVGLFESADGGTIFLDEVGELPMSLQVKLLRVIEEREVLRVGSRTPHRIDVRFICATNRDPEAEIARGAFRQDLFFRLNGITLTIPPLRERPLEIAPLADAFAANAAKQLGRPKAPLLSAAAIAAMVRYRWPGNIRELRNVVDRAMVLCTGDVVGPELLPAKLTTGAVEEPLPPPTESARGEEPRSGRDSVPSAPPAEGNAEAPGERERIIRALEQCAGNQTRAAELLGISRRTLVSRLKEYDLPRPRKAP